MLEDVEEDGFDGDPAVFVAFAADLDDGAVVGAADVADVGAHQVVGAQPASSPVMMRRGPPSQSVDRGRCGSVDAAASRAVTDWGEGFGSDLGCLGRPTIGIGLAGISSAVNRKVHSTFHATSSAELTRPRGCGRTRRTPNAWLRCR